MQNSKCKNTISFVTKYISHIYKQLCGYSHVLYLCEHIYKFFFFSGRNQYIYAPYIWLTLGEGVIEVKGEKGPSIFSLVAFFIF